MLSSAVIEPSSLTLPGPTYLPYEANRSRGTRLSEPNCAYDRFEFGFSPFMLTPVPLLKLGSINGLELLALNEAGLSLS